MAGAGAGGVEEEALMTHLRRTTGSRLESHSQLHHRFEDRGEEAGSQDSGRVPWVVLQPVMPWAIVVRIGAMQREALEVVASAVVPPQARHSLLGHERALALEGLVGGDEEISF
jgi:hypothetical protein